MDPGNWATDLAGGSKYGYTLNMGIADEQHDGLITPKLKCKIGNCKRKRSCTG